MEQIDIDEFNGIERSFSRAERRRITRFCRIMERMSASCEAAFEALGSPAENVDVGVHTWFLSAITPARLEAAARQIENLSWFFLLEWRKVTGPRARVLLRAVRDCDAAVAAIRTRLAEIEPVVKEQDALFEQFERLIKQLGEKRR